MWSPRRLVLPALATATLGCSDSRPAPSTGGGGSGRVAFPTDLADKVQTRDDAIDVAPAQVPRSLPNAAVFVPQLAYTLTLVAEVEPPDIDGTPLQATAIDFQDDRAVVSYNMAGASQLGAVDVFVFDAQRRPNLVSRATFSDTDVSAAGFVGGRIWLATATSDESFSSPAVLEALSLSADSQLGLTGHERLALSSYAATSIAGRDGRVFVTTGNTGGVFAIDADSGAVVAQAALDDARWSAAPGDGTVVVVQGTPGRVTVLDAADLSERASFPFDGAGIPESKSTIEVAGGKAFVAGGPGGALVIDLATGAVIADIPVPNDPSVAAENDVTNAVSTDGDLVFISNGEGGVSMAQASAPVSDAYDAASPPSYVSVGRLVFPEPLTSVNHITYRNGFLFVASGLGGLKIVRVDSQTRVCPAGHWGPSCDQTCAIEGCTGEITCDRDSGAAIGCSACEAGSWGTQCENPCDTGQCVGTVTCSAKGELLSCDGCLPGRWGPTCADSCTVDACVGELTCDRDSGAPVSCSTCAGGHWGTLCEASCDPTVGSPGTELEFAL